jgi:hypothetical protein
MTHLNASPPVSASFSDMPSGVIPLVSTLVPAADISPALCAALDARDAEKAALMDIEANLLQALRPEIERLTTQLVRSSVREIWAKRSDLVS